jgi:hypothetical protein
MLAADTLNSVTGIACLLASFGYKCETYFGNVVGISLILPSFMRMCSCVLVYP